MNTWPNWDKHPNTMYLDDGSIIERHFVRQVPECMLWSRSFADEVNGRDFMYITDAEIPDHIRTFLELFDTHVGFEIQWYLKPVFSVGKWWITNHTHGFPMEAWEKVYIHMYTKHAWPEDMLFGAVFGDAYVRSFAPLN